ncbi:hypothetical protein SADUNF_Sadunf08G0145500 [Salix dunnii]|uniref:Uncharacterized protein n=1 Tax=Salix dunnii TaxID=1413687 RepID=A0A835K135_9ROSI|nr:hypothetical protein SADUNF_Sadunf08G0145500 [Salix dunnii]
MDCKDMEGNGAKTRSLRFEGYSNRSVFLRSYPLHFGAEDENTNDEMVSTTNNDTVKKPIRRMFLVVIQWGEGKVLVLRKFKHKLQLKARHNVNKTKERGWGDMVYTDAFI